MAKKKRVRKPDDLTLAQLQQLMDERSSELSELKSQRSELQKQIKELDRQIRQTEGVGAKTRGPGRKKSYGAATTKSPTRKKKKVARKGKRTRPKNEKSAKGYAEEILRGEPKGLKLNDLADRILAAGYKSNSSNFTNTLYQSLYKDRQEGNTFSFNDKTGLWTVK